VWLRSFTEPNAWVTDNALCLTEISPDLDARYLFHALTTLNLRKQANQAAQLGILKGSCFHITGKRTLADDSES
jgi:hypothetical protein